MKFSCLQENLSKGLQVVSKAVPTKGPLPILSNILISAEQGRLKLVATDLETTIITYVNASVDEEGSVTVPARILKEFVTNLSPSTIEAKLDRDILHLTSQKTKSKFNGTSSADFPELPTIDTSVDAIEVDAKEFARAVAVVAFASATDESKPVFTGIFLSFADNILTIASTDGFRLSEKALILKTVSKEFTTIIPAKTLSEVTKIFSNATEPLKIIISEDANTAVFQADDTTIYTRILDGQYPDYKRIIPANATLKAQFNEEEFSEAVKLTNIFLKEGDNNTLKIRFDPKGVIRVASLADEQGSHESELAAEIEGEMLEVAFSAKYLLDFLNNVKCPILVFETSGNKSACLLRPQNQVEHEGFLHIIMPIQI